MTREGSGQVDKPCFWVRPRQKEGAGITPSLPGFPKHRDDCWLWEAGLWARGGWGHHKPWGAGCWAIEIRSSDEPQQQPAVCPCQGAVTGRPRWCSLKCAVASPVRLSSTMGWEWQMYGPCPFPACSGRTSCFCCLTIGCPVFSFASHRPSPCPFHSHSIRAVS